MTCAKYNRPCPSGTIFKNNYCGMSPTQTGPLDSWRKPPTQIVPLDNFGKLGSSESDAGFQIVSLTDQLFRFCPRLSRLFLPN